MKNKKLFLIPAGFTFVIFGILVGFGISTSNPKVQGMEMVINTPSPQLDAPPLNNSHVQLEINTPAPTTEPTLQPSQPNPSQSPCN